ncbi:MAG: hypothetical protein JNM17_14820 [Archangium sp.]|nr:hypothetical protein [Archangium sp.]
MLLALALATMSAVSDAEVEKSWRALLEARGEKVERSPSITFTPMPQKALAGLSFVRVSAWGAGGHRRLEPVVFIREGETLRVLRVMQQNLDENGYHRSLTALWSCEVEFERSLRAVSQSMDMKQYSALEAERPKRCKSLLEAVKAAPPTEEFALFLVALALEVDHVTPISSRTDPKLDSRLKRLLDVKDAGPASSADLGDVSWVGAPVEFKPWKKNAGFVTTASPPWLVQVDATLGANFSLVTKQLGFAREYIE